MKKENLKEIIDSATDGIRELTEKLLELERENKVLREKLNMPNEHDGVDYDRIVVSSVQVYPFTEGPSIGHVKGLATVTLNDQFMIRGLRVTDGENGLFVGYPVDPFFKGETFRSVCNPVCR